MAKDLFNVTFVPIKAEKLNVKVFKDAIDQMLEIESEMQQENLKLTVKTWRNPPTFTSRTTKSGGSLRVLTGPTGDAKAVKIWVWLDQGTRPHRIVPRTAKRLRFQKGYSAKTTVGSFSSSLGGAFGPTVFSMGVMHPGTKPRMWIDTLSRRRQPAFTKKSAQLMEKAANNAF